MSARSSSFILPLAALLCSAPVAAQWRPATGGAPISAAVYAVRGDGPRCRVRVLGDLRAARHALRDGRLSHARRLLRAANRAAAYSCGDRAAAAIGRALADLDRGGARYRHAGRGGYGELPPPHGRRSVHHERWSHHRHSRGAYGPGYADAPVVRAMAPGAFASLAAQVRKQTFGRDKIAVISTAARHNHFTSDQVRLLLGTFTFGRDKITALRSLAPRIVDRGNTHVILGVFTFSKDKRTAQSILGGA